MRARSAHHRRDDGGAREGGQDVPQLVVLQSPALDALAEVAVAGRQHVQQLVELGAPSPHRRVRRKALEHRRELEQRVVPRGRHGRVPGGPARADAHGHRHLLAHAERVDRAPVRELEAEAGLVEGVVAAQIGSLAHEPGHADLSRRRPPRRPRRSGGRRRSAPSRCAPARRARPRWRPSGTSCRAPRGPRGGRRAPRR